jgi:spore germination protein PF
MPSIVGPVKINSAAGIVNFGDSLYTSPKSASKSSAGAGAFNTGDFLMTNNGLSLTNTVDPDVADQNIAGNS